MEEKHKDVHTVTHTESHVDSANANGTHETAKSHSDHAKSGHTDSHAPTDAHDAGYGDLHDSGHGGARKRRHYASHAGRRSFKDTAFLGLIAATAIVIALFFLGSSLVLNNLLQIALILIFLFLINRYNFLIQLKEYERAIVFTLGKATSVRGPGWTVIFPPLQSITRVDTRTRVLDVPPQSVVTNDGVEVVIDAVIYMKVKSDKESVFKSVLEVQDVESASKKFVVASLRDVIGNISLRELISRIENMNKLMQQELEKIVKEWGVNIEAVKIQDVKIPKIVMDAMLEEKAAVQRKLARFEEAEAHEREISAVRNAAENLSDKAIAYYYVRALEKIGSSDSTKFVLPMELTRFVESISKKKFSRADIGEIFLEFEPELRAMASLGKKKKQ